MTLKKSYKIFSKSMYYNKSTCFWKKVLVSFFFISKKTTLILTDLTIKLDKAYNNLENYKNLPLKRSPDGSIITLSDVARVELGAQSTRTLFKGDGKQVVGIGIYQQSNANTIKVADGVKKKIKELRPSLPPGTTLEVSFDRSNYIKAAIKEVYKTLFIALILVTIIIYLFLGNIRALIVPIIALPVSLISTFLGPKTPICNQKEDCSGPPLNAKTIGLFSVVPVFL